jgi:hypothetical protein
MFYYNNNNKKNIATKKISLMRFDLPVFGVHSVGFTARVYHDNIIFVKFIFGFFFFFFIEPDVELSVKTDLTLDRYARER